MGIVTKTGDNGETGLYDGQRVPKADPRMELLGDLDELSAHLGFSNTLRGLQQDLFELSALIGHPKSKEDFEPTLKRIEVEIEKLEPMLPALTNFIFQGGCPEAAHLFLARAVCRRAERHATLVAPLPRAALPYLNRLSDYLFLLARKANFDSGTPETLWYN